MTPQTSPVTPRLAAAALSICGLLATGTIATPAASAAPKAVASCQALDHPGSYQLTADLSTIEATCIGITASDVRLDLAGHTLACTGSGFAIFPVAERHPSA